MFTLICDIQTSDGRSLTSVEISSDELDPSVCNPMDIGERVLYALDLVDLDSIDADE